MKNICKNCGGDRFFEITNSQVSIVDGDGELITVKQGDIADYQCIECETEIEYSEFHERIAS